MAGRLSPRNSTAGERQIRHADHAYKGFYWETGNEKVGEGEIERITNMPVCLFRGAAGKELEWVELVS